MGYYEDFEEDDYEGSGFMGGRIAKGKMNVKSYFDMQKKMLKGRFPNLSSNAINKRLENNARAKYGDVAVDRYLSGKGPKKAKSGSKKSKSSIKVPANASKADLAKILRKVAKALDK